MADNPQLSRGDTTVESTPAAPGRLRPWVVGIIVTAGVALHLALLQIVGVFFAQVSWSDLSELESTTIAAVLGPGILTGAVGAWLGCARLKLWRCLGVLAVCGFLSTAVEHVHAGYQYRSLGIEEAATAIRDRGGPRTEDEHKLVRWSQWRARPTTTGYYFGSFLSNLLVRSQEFGIALLFGVVMRRVALRRRRLAG